MKKFLFRHEKKVRYLIVGGWNTAFGYLLFIVLYELLNSRINYIAILVLSYVLSITNAFLCYKFLVFKTKGNYLKEYLRFYVVYGAAFLLNLAMLPFFVEILKVSPVLSQGLIVSFTVLISYIGHNNFSFSVSPDGIDEDSLLRQQQTVAQEDELENGKNSSQIKPRE